MSIGALGYVWKNSKSEGGTLLVEMAIADEANDNCEAVTSIRNLGEKARLSDRQVQRATKQLVKSGEIEMKRSVNKMTRFRLLNLPRHFVQLRQNVTPESDPKVSPQPPLPSPGHPPSEGNGKPVSTVNSFISAWCEGYRLNFGRGYVVTRGKDHGRAKGLLCDSGLSANQLMQIAHMAWRKSAPNNFFCQKLTSISWFHGKFNEIQSELANVSGTKIERPKSIYELKIVMESKQKLLDGLRAKHKSEVAGGAMWTNEAAQQEAVTLSSEIKQLRQQISNFG